MCVAIPGKIVEITGHTAKADVMNNLIEVNIQLVSPKVGDYVLIHAGCVLEVLQKETALELLGLFRELEEEVNGTAVKRDEKTEKL